MISLILWCIDRVTAFAKAASQISASYSRYRRIGMSPIDSLQTAWEIHRDPDS